MRARWTKNSKIGALAVATGMALVAGDVKAREITTAFGEVGKPEMALDIRERFGIAKDAKMRVGVYEVDGNDLDFEIRGDVVWYLPKPFDGEAPRLARTQGFVVAVSYSTSGKAGTIIGPVIFTPALEPDEVKKFSEEYSIVTRACEKGETAVSDSLPFKDTVPPCPKVGGAEDIIVARADGTLERPAKRPLRDSQGIQLRILARSWFKDRYQVTATDEGEAPSAIRGSVTAVVGGLTSLGKLVNGLSLESFDAEATIQELPLPGADHPQVRGESEKLKNELDKRNALAWASPTLELPDDPRAKSLKLNVALLGTELTRSTEITIDHKYLVNIVGLLVIGQSKDRFSIDNGKIAKSEEDTPMDFLLGLEVYPAGWFDDECNFSDEPRSCGRYFGPNRRFRDRFSVIAGIPLKDLGESAFLGLGFELFSGVKVSAGWLPRQEQSLKTGYAIGDAFMGTDAPVNKEWELSSWGFAVGFDSSLLKLLSN